MNMTEIKTITRSIKFKTSLTAEQIMPTVNEWLRVCNAVSTIAFENNCVSNNVRLHRLSYAQMRSEFSLSSQMTCNAIRFVASKYSTAKSNKHKLQRPIRFSKPSMVLQLKYDFQYLKDGLSVQSLDGRIKGVQSTNYAYAEQFKDWKKGGCVIQIVNDEVYLIQYISKEVEIAQPTGNIVGIDRGINYIAVATDGTKQMFCKSGKTKQRKRRYQKTRSSLQKKKAEHLADGKSIKSVQKVLNRLSGRERRFMKDVNHCVSKQIVAFAVNNKAATITLEDLEGIRKSAKSKGKTMRKMINQWSFFELQQFIEYKAKQAGINVESVAPEYTSQSCSKCGYTHEDNRKRHSFKCLSCGYQLHSDLNASRNIRLRSVVIRQDLYNDGLQVNQPLSGHETTSPAFSSGIY